MMHQAGRGFPNNAAAAAANMRRMNQQQHMPNTGKICLRERRIFKKEKQKL